MANILKTVLPLWETVTNRSDIWEKLFSQFLPGFKSEISDIHYGKVLIEFYCNGSYDIVAFVSIT